MVKKTSGTVHPPVCPQPEVFLVLMHRAPTLAMNEFRVRWLLVGWPAEWDDPDAPSGVVVTHEEATDFTLQGVFVHDATSWLRRCPHTTLGLPWPLTRPPRW